jgi:hypothetical protein
VCAYGALAAALAVAAYFTLFSEFAFYDDEGTLLVTVNAFAHGDTLYRDIYSPYGPFYYDLFGGLFALTGWAVTTDASRLIVDVVWVGSSILFGLSAQRLTGLLSLGIAGTIVAFGALGVLAGEPMHPQGLCVLLLGGLTLLATSGPGRRSGWSGAAAGVLLGALLMTKVNLGSFAAIAVALAAVLTCEPLYRRRWLRWPAILALLGLPFVLMSPDFREEWVRQLVALEFFAALAVAVAAHTARPSGNDPDRGLSRWLLGALAAGVLTVGVILTVLLLTGPSVSEAYDGIVSQGLKLREVFTIPLSSPASAVDWGILAATAATLALWLRGAGSGRSVWPGVARIGAGVVIWFTVVGSSPFSISPTGNHIALPLALAWVAALAPVGVVEPQYRRFLRVLLPLLAVEQTLQVYPVAGSQVGIASVTFVAVGALCIADGLGLLRAWNEARDGWPTGKLSAVAATIATTLVAIFGMHAIVNRTATNLVSYREWPALPFPGAHRMHLAPPQGEEYAELVDLLHRHRCTTFVGYPNIDSLYLFSGITPPKPSAPGAWVIVLPNDQQQRVVGEMRASPRPCAFRKDSIAEAWLHGTPVDESDPLVHYIFNDFRTVATVGEFQFMLPKAGPHG